MTTKARYEPPQCSYTVQGPRVKTDGSVLGKVSGTMIGGIRGISPWSTPFSVACDLLGLGRQDVSDKPAVKTGKVLEEKIVAYLREAYPDTGTFIPARELYEERTGPHNEWTPDYDDDVFTGHIDGAVMTDDGESYILEVKTSANMGSWIDGVPEYYYWQVALYNHFLTHQDKAYVALGIVDEKTHKDPESWVPSQSNVVLMEVDIDQEEASRVFDEIREWYAELKATHATPMYDATSLKVDVPLYAHLVTLASDEDSMRSLVDEVGYLESQISQKMEEIDHLQSQKDVLRARLKDFLEGRNMPEMKSTSGDFYAVMGTQTRKKVSAEKLRAAGIDPEPFTEIQTINTFTVKKSVDMTKDKEE